MSEPKKVKIDRFACAMAALVLVSLFAALAAVDIARIVYGVPK